jgi:aldose 1-epimerase
MILKELRASQDAAGEGPRLLSAVVAPDRGMMLVALTARLADGREVDLVTTPPRPDLAAKFGGPDDFAGNASFAFGGAILLPYANRIRGRPLPQTREIETEVLGKTVRLPMNWGGKAPGAERYAMHGLLLDRAFEVAEEGGGVLAGVLRAGSFSGRWPSVTEVTVTYRLAPAALTLTVTAANVGREVLPMGIGWHLYLNLPSGRRAEARLHLPATQRLAVDNYDTVLPTGEVSPISGTAYDFSPPEGRPLGDLYLDDCFVGLRPHDRRAEAMLTDPAASLALRISAAVPPVTAFQVYAPPDKPFVAIEPQFNRADPFGAVWHGEDTGMVLLRPGEATTYDVRVELSGR